jgi:hypothetical protein
LKRLENIKAEAERFRGYVVKQMRTALTKKNKNASKDLYNSIEGEIVGEPPTMDIIFKTLPYGKFVDQGVNGVQLKHGSPFSFKSKGGVRGLKGMPPPSALDKWIVLRGIAPRDKSGRFMTRKQTQFMIARGIFLNGITPSLFFTKTFEDAMNRAGKDFVNALGSDIAIYMDEVIKESNKKRKK